MSMPFGLYVNALLVPSLQSLFILSNVRLKSFFMHLIYFIIFVFWS